MNLLTSPLRSGTFVVASAILFLLAATPGHSAEETPPAPDDCSEKDSISCLQSQIYRSAKDLFEKPKVELWGGLSLERKPVAEDSRIGKSLDEKTANSAIPKDKEEALEEYVVDKAASFLQERSITLDLGEAAKTLKEAVQSQAVEEGRGKKKKLLKALLPILIGIKMKLAGFLVLSYFVIALIAKKALLASLISLAVSGFIAIRKLLMGQQHQPHHEVHEVSHGWAAAAPSYGGGGGGGWDTSSYDAHGAYSNSVAHSIAYPGQKPSARYSEKSSM